MRSVYHEKCGEKFIAGCKKYNETYREVRGKLAFDCRCDWCGDPLSEGDQVILLTMHPCGPDVIGRWEDEYLTAVA